MLYSPCSFAIHLFAGLIWCSPWCLVDAAANASGVISTSVKAGDESVPPGAVIDVHQGWGGFKRYADKRLQKILADAMELGFPVWMTCMAILAVGVTAHGIVHRGWRFPVLARAVAMLRRRRRDPLARLHRPGAHSSQLHHSSFTSSPRGRNGRDGHASTATVSIVDIEAVAPEEAPEEGYQMITSPRPAECRE
jgi:hypothetical protein